MSTKGLVVDMAAHTATGMGNDTIDGGTGNDRLIGSDGADIFRFSGNSGTDLIADFNSNDKIDLSALGVSFADLNIQPFFGDTLITIDGLPSVLIGLDGVLPGDVTASDFIF